MITVSINGNNHTFEQCSLANSQANSSRLGKLLNSLVMNSVTALVNNDDTRLDTLQFIDLLVNDPDEMAYGVWIAIGDFACNHQFEHNTVDDL